MNAIAAERTPLSLQSGPGLLMVRLLVAGKKPPTPAKAREEIGRLLEQPPSTESFQSWLEQMRADGLIVQRGMRLTAEGRLRALETLGIAELPPRSNWQTIQKRYLLPRALGLDPESEEARSIPSGKSLPSFLLKHRFHLRTAANVSVDRMLVALTCHVLDMPEETTLADLQVAVLDRLLGERLPPGKVKELAPRLLLQSRKGDARSLQEAVLRNWLRAASSSPVERETAPRQMAIEERGEFDLPAFAHTVLAAARDVPTGRFGDNKVFINHVWQHLAAEPALGGMNLPRFKERLIEAHRMDLLTLSRADLANLLDPHDVAESETHYLNGVFHFLLIEKERP